LVYIAAMDELRCPECEGELARVLYYGVPHWFCMNEDCCLLFGFWASFTRYLPFNGVLFAYPPGQYLSALWKFLLGLDWEH
jgi:hypothetical protein